MRRTLIIPTIAPQQSGQLMNGLSFTVAGSGFGSKSGSRPTAWDYGQAGPGVLDSQWTGGWPNACAVSDCNIFNRAGPFTSSGAAAGSSTIPSPTPYTANFIAGCHGGINASNGGNNVMFWKKYTTPAFPYYSIWSYYQRYDPNWWFTTWPGLVTFNGTATSGNNVITGVNFPITGLTVGDSNNDVNDSFFGGTTFANNTKITAVDTVLNTITCSNNALVTRTAQFGVVYTDRDENVKTWDYSTPGTTPYDSNSWYGNNQGGVTKSNTASATYVSGISGSPTRPQYPDNNGHNNFWHPINNQTNPNIGWYKVDIVAKWDSSTTGFFRIYETDLSGNGIADTAINFSGANAYPAQVGTTTGESIGGYARNQGYVGQIGLITPLTTTGAVNTQTQWRYFGNIYFDVQPSSLGRFYLTNSSTFTMGGGQVAEIQPYTSWSDSSVILVCNKGNLTSGAVRLWFVDEANGVNTPVLQNTYSLQ
jgi:hypothetical protein